MTAAEERTERARLVSFADEALSAAVKAAYALAERDAEPGDYAVWTRLGKARRYLAAAVAEAELSEVAM